MDDYTRTCPMCGVEFNARIGRSKKSRTYCSLICSNKSRANGFIDCPVCHTAFKQKSTKEGEKRYCSTKCGAASRKGKPSPKRYPEHVREYIARHYEHGDTHAIADFLGIPFASVRHIAEQLGIRKDLSRMNIVNSAKMRAKNPMHSPETIEKVKQHYRDNPLKYQRIQAALTRGRANVLKTKPTKPELKCAQYLDELGVEYEAQSIVKDKFIVDFRIGNVILQVDGEYWHGHPRFEPLTSRQIAQRKKDASQDKYLTACGYRVLRIWERDITPDNLRELLSH